MCGAAAPDGYTFLANKDSYGNDIKRLAGPLYYDARDWPALTEACSDDASCVAVNTEGDLKYALAPEGSWYWWDYFGAPDPCKGTLVKNGS